MPKKTLACFVIDDPPLRPNYGCLNYQRLLDEMMEHRFFTEIAFIPWNYRRSDRNTVKLFADNTDYFGICVHGCNHTANEFGIDEYLRLWGLSTTALLWMERHREQTGLSYDPIMVFPQGRFSWSAIRALKDTGYRAAVNSTLITTGGIRVPRLEYKMTPPAASHAFPILLRRYPRDEAAFAQDVTLGRPIIIVEHVGAFRNGYKTITDLVDRINAFGNIEWKPLSRIVEHYFGVTETYLSQSEHVWELKRGKIERVQTAFRRYACEFRDNFIERTDLLSWLYNSTKASTHTESNPLWPKRVS